jgi:hypothetical protein
MTNTQHAEMMLALSEINGRLRRIAESCERAEARAQATDDVNVEAQRPDPFADSLAAAIVSPNPPAVSVKRGKRQRGRP